MKQTYAGILVCMTTVGHHPHNAAHCMILRLALHQHYMNSREDGSPADAFGASCQNS
eukprot:CAMPEP_0179050480 /NCGR_PEP_ID=MMETSP0796-20121207/20748_1 /TAXON_ID=73915 /ORGANISM="Pyrodinium bahamense, Strain pbaha01" /LENGTH=56 /DNA_ID=CAMNT_0020746985 /DNA_START=70 /DNA_END=240 /DNA_ORIENTATION=-